MLYKCEKNRQKYSYAIGTRSGKQLFFPYPSVFAESYVRCENESCSPNHQLVSKITTAKRMEYLINGLNHFNVVHLCVFSTRKLVSSFYLCCCRCFLFVCFVVVVFLF